MKDIIFLFLLLIIFIGCKVNNDAYDESQYILIKIDSSDIKGKVSSKMYSCIFDTSRRLFIYFWDNDSIMFKGFNHGLKKDGAWEYFFYTGKINSQEIYKDGVKIGAHKFFYSNGNLKSINFFKDGILNYTNTFDTNGVIVK